MVNDIKLTSAMRSNLLSLQGTQGLMDRTQNRLATGLKVNSAIDNPSSFFTAQGLNQRAGDLTNLMDSMGQGIQTLKAADEGIKSLTKFAEQLKSIANQALETTDGDRREALMEQFNAVIVQMDDLAGDSGYKGVNLLAGDSLTVNFNEDRTSKITVVGVDGTAAGDLSIADGAGWKPGGTDASDIAAANTAVMTALNAAEDAVNTLRNWASEFGNAYSILQTREDFTDNLVNVLTEGADKLTLADMNEESANMLALQTRQQLGINSLSLASQAAQSVLKLF